MIYLTKNIQISLKFHHGDRLLTKPFKPRSPKKTLWNTAITFAQNYPNPRSPKKTLWNTAIAFSPKELNRDRRKKRYEIPRSLLHKIILNRDRETNTLRKTAIAFAQNYPKPRSPKKIRRCWFTVWISKDATFKTLAQTGFQMYAKFDFIPWLSNAKNTLRKTAIAFAPQELNCDHWWIED